MSKTMPIEGGPGPEKRPSIGSRTDHGHVGGRPPSDAAQLPRLALRPILLIAALGAIPLLLTLTRYGYHRDELYFLACGRRLAWGYVDQPPLIPLIARLSDTFAPGSLADWPAWRGYG